jgi:serine/threonine protein phosphatase PrpC
MNCPACGADNREDARFCRRCGTDISKAIPPPAVDAAADRPVVAREEPRVPETPQAETKVEARAKREGELESGGEEGVKAPKTGSVSAPEAPLDLIAEAADAGQEVGEVQAAPEGTAAEEAGSEEAGPEEAVTGGTTSVGGEGDLPLAEAAHEVPPEPEATAPAEDQLAQEDEDLPELDGGVLGFWREETEPIRPVEVGTLLADRYQIMEALDVQKESILYQANDLVRCWQCGFEGNIRGDAFCAKCGAAQDRRVHVRLLQVRDDDSALLEEETVAKALVHDGQTYLLLAEEVPEPQEEVSQVWGIRLLVGQRSDTGLVRELDEDSLLCLTIMPSYEARMGPVLGLFSVADGMGGHEGGEMASKMAIQVLAEKAMKDIILPMMAGELVLDEDVAALLRRVTIAANDAVYLARQKRGNDMGTTLTTVLVRDERLFVAHVGDSRAYRWNAQGLEQLTVDHSVVASMIAEGQIGPEEIYTHPHRSVVYRCVGDKPTVEVDTDMLPLAPGDRILLCSDGLWEMIRDEGIEDVLMQEAEPQAAADLLVKHANVAGGEDNISVIVVQVETI